MYQKAHCMKEKRKISRHATSHGQVLPHPFLIVVAMETAKATAEAMVNQPNIAISVTMSMNRPQPTPTIPPFG